MYFVTALICSSFILQAERDYTENTPVAAFYRQHHTHQTLDFVLNKKQYYTAQIASRKYMMSVWQVLEILNSIVDDSDPDTSLPQIQHALQTAEKIRADNQPDWLILVGLIHDLGKLLVTFDEPQWAVVGDTFPVGCAYQPHIIYPNYLQENHDIHNKTFQTVHGIYRPHCGLANVHMSFGHDEYLYQVVKDYVPEEALYIIRYHSFYPQHQHNDYDHLLDEHDQKMFAWVRLFQQYDLYSKNTATVDVDAVKEYYQSLINKYFPATIAW